MKTKQMQLFKETKEERCQRLLARLGDKRIKTAGVYFSEKAAAEADARARGWSDAEQLEGEQPHA